MDKRVRERRRLVGRERGRRRAGLIFLCALALVALALFLWLRSADVFAVREVTASATRHVTSEQIAEAAAGAKGVSLLKVSTSGIEKQLRKLPYVRTVHVYRHFPNALEVRIEEYEPAARVQLAGGEVWWVADNGRALETAKPSVDAPLPLFVPAARFALRAGETVPEAVVAAFPVAALVQAPGAPPALPAMEWIAVATGGEIVVHLAGGIELRLGTATDLKQKMTVARDIIQERLRDGKTLKYVDASVADRVAVKAE